MSNEKPVTLAKVLAISAAQIAKILQGPHIPRFNILLANAPLLPVTPASTPDGVAASKELVKKIQNTVRVDLEVLLKFDSSKEAPLNVGQAVDIARHAIARELGINENLLVIKSAPTCGMKSFTADPLAYENNQQVFVDPKLQKKDMKLIISLDSTQLGPINKSKPLHVTISGETAIVKQDDKTLSSVTALDKDKGIKR